MSDSSNIRAAQEVHHKFEFYLVALSFTISGFAMQTGKFNNRPIGDSIEIASWVFLFLSGALGLWRLEYIPVLFRSYDQLDKKKADIERYSMSPEHSQSVAILQKQVDEVKPKLATMESNNYRKYFWQKLFFLLGLFSLLLARCLAQMYLFYI